MAGGRRVQIPTVVARIHPYGCSQNRVGAHRRFTDGNPIAGAQQNRYRVESPDYSEAN